MEIAKYIEQTLLKPASTREQITSLCEQAKEHQFHGICVNPTYLSQAKKLLQGSDVQLVTVVGFPLGNMTPESKAFETRDALSHGADEIDMVINIAAVKNAEWELVERDIATVVTAAAPTPVKVIIETVLLSHDEKIKACQISQKAGAQFVKTSTGFAGGGATVEDVKLMRKTVGPEMGLKASGGVRDAETAVAMIKAGATRIGTSSGVEIVSGSPQSSKHDDY